MIGIPRFLIATMGFAFAHAAAETLPDMKGVWERIGSGDYSAYLRLDGKEGFSCVLDGKSSHAFSVIGDSVTTPMNGMDKITWSPGSGDLEITGEEKGEPYSSRYRQVPATAYPAACAVAEGESAVSLQRPKKPGVATAIPARNGAARDWLGRALRP